MAPIFQINDRSPTSILKRSVYSSKYSHFVLYATKEKNLFSYNGHQMHIKFTLSISIFRKMHLISSSRFKQGTRVSHYPKTNPAISIYPLLSRQRSRNLTQCIKHAPPHSLRHVLLRFKLIFPPLPSQVPSLLCSPALLI